MTNELEFFAEMSVVYFCGYTDQAWVRCASELRRYDPETYAVIHAVYRESEDLLLIERGELNP